MHNTRLYDVVVVGGGIVGCVVALALAKETAFTIGILEEKKPLLQPVSSVYHSRVSAIALSSKHILDYLQAWDAIVKKRVSPYEMMHVWDANSDGSITFTANALHEETLGFIIEDRIIRASLLELIQKHPQIDFLCPLTVSSLQETSDEIILTTMDQSLISARLLVAADGQKSWVRRRIGIPIQTLEYHQTAIVSTVQSELSHEKIARQVFLPTGPLAFLPLSEANTSSIVWSTTPDDAAYLLSLEDSTFCEVLADAVGYRLGNILSTTKRLHFPLQMRHAKQYVRSRIALVGDCAHTIHPLIGQGMNLGLLDAAMLAEVVIEAYHKKRDYASLATLRRYERCRKSDTVMMLTMVDMLRHLFSSQRQSIKKIRSFGLTMTDQWSFLKNNFARYALGKREGLPKMAYYRT